MSNVVHNTRPIFCNNCNRSNAVARIQEIQNGNIIITQAKWVCPLCSSVVKVGEIGRKVKE